MNVIVIVIVIVIGVLELKVIGNCNCFCIIKRQLHNYFEMRLGSGLNPTTT